MKKIITLFLISFTYHLSFSQVDTTFIYNENMPYGTLDLRISKTATRYYYLQEDVTFSYRESAPGVRTNTYFDMTSWDSKAYGQGNLREKNGAADAFVMNYRLLKPVGYDANYAKGYPLIIMFHGAGERANCWDNTCYHSNRAYSPATNDPPAPTDASSKLLNNDHNLLHGGKIYLDAVNLAGNKRPDDPSLANRAFPGFVLFPQTLNGWTGSQVQDALRIIRILVKKYNIDEDRIYVNGLSLGGYAAYEAMKRAPWMFAAAITMSAVNDAGITSRDLQSTITHIPNWTFQGGLDKEPTPDRTRRYVKLFKDAGAIVKLTEYPDLGHTTWNRAYNEPDFFKWMLGVNKASIHVFAGTPSICSDEGLKLQLPEGFKAYQWQMNGQIINGANQATFIAKASAKYRARFSRVENPTEADWNEWSPEVNVTVQPNPPVAEIRQVGTVMLKDLNGGNQARLESVGEFAHYYWYKNGTLLNLPGDQDDTVRYLNVTSTMGNGAYTLVVANYDNCNSAPTAAKNVFFNDQAPMTISAPTNFNGQSSSPSQINLQWTDNAQDEIGYEIWRRRRTGDNQFSTWEMVTLTAANTTSYSNTGLLPSSVYQYKTRAVSNTARSQYAPSANDVLQISTAADTQAPQAPLNLKSKRLSLETFQLMWSPAQDNAGIGNYIISINDQTIKTQSADTTFSLNDLEINGVYKVQVAAVDLGGNEGTKSNTITIYNGITGLFYGHSAGYWANLDSINWAKPEYTGFVDNFTLSPKTQDDYFSFRFDGFLFITTPGSYQFRTSSDDGSRLSINKNIIVKNDGVHDLKTVESKAITLSEGPQRITVDFFDYIETDTLIVEYKGPDTNNQWALIPSAALKSGLVVGTEPDVPVPFVANVFPNPTVQSNINLQIDTRHTGLIDITLIDPIGREVFSNQYSMDQGSTQLQIAPEQNLKQGMYLIRVKQGDYIKQHKVIIRE
ncbi:fibronectin type III domain-containing protein [Chryseosolibacter indicus]|uniref:Prolyl oligopeptidase family serine peptidase n=1 Tax=Chryseosolibacter indicus TaxID=2782351 RepID=A0ABS5VWU3_9BACT|nr:PA14 domain-containing protein [Chryseosolibacter indicus]MBT1705305.1 prolyl oligopeptidase family serine peptidase [Chryseosolibacter indicus]